MPTVEKLGRYELVRHLASGGMARVYLARVSGVGGFERHVVLKTVRPERAEDDSYVNMFLDEARLIATLHHQHVAQVHEIGVADDGTYFLAMEYLHGETLRAVLELARVRDFKIPLDFTFTVVCAAAAGLHHAHDRRGSDGAPLGIVHRDVSPSNVIVGFDGSIKLIDFGIAKAQDRSTTTQTGFVKGKAGYMAPEQALGYPVDRRSDVFALGVVAYELSTQTRAFRAASEFEAVQRIVKGDLVPPSKVAPGYPPELEAVVMTALQTDADDRFPDADAMRRAFELTAHHLGITMGVAAVDRVLVELFGRKPEPWLVEGPEPPEEATVVDSESPPLLRMPAAPRRATPPPRQLPLAADADEPQTSRYVTVVPELPPLPLVPLAPTPTPEALRLALGTTPPPSRMRAATVPIRHVTPPPRVIPPPAVTPPLTVTPPPRPPRALGTITSISAITPLPRGRLGIWITIGVSAIVAVGFTAMITGEAEDSRLAASAQPISAVPATQPLPVRAPAPAPIADLPEPAPEIEVSPDLVTLRVTSTPEGATVVLDGVRLGTTPFVTTVAAGPREAILKVRKRGRIPQKMRVRFDDDVVWDVRLSRR